MTTHLDSVTMSHDTSWTWNLTPLLMAALALSVVFFPEGKLPMADAEAAQPMRAEAVSFAQLVPSPQPGVGEPALVAAELPQSY